MRGKLTELTGKTFGYWEVIELNHITNRGAYWYCRCTYCDNIYSVSATGLLDGNSKCCDGCSRKLNGIKHRKPLIELATTAVYTQYKNNALKRNLNFDISKKDVEFFMIHNCYYCGGSPSNTYTGNSAGYKRYKRNDFLYNGIDRLDNTKGYTLENCVSCCKICNRAKSDMTEEEFLSWINSLISFRTSNE